MWQLQYQKNSGLFSAYIIGRTALDHLQTVGLTDAMSLMPGGKTNTRPDISLTQISAIRNITPAQVEENYRRIKEEVFAIVESEMERIYDTPELAELLVTKSE